ncbi:uncharacterized protein [Venturia canescens]|uniref:uncharacterized protein isoform X2 n=1 Tax=Venturia canescens TaxID=32260 RepID=UPI001C9BE883|nr:uncharacterized protein LOC122407333 isoform X2 [Venturia canescens]
MSRECQKVFKANGILERIRVLCESRKLRNSAILNVEEKRVTKSCKLIFSERQIRVVEKVIVANTEISRCHLTPELKLHLLTPNCRLYNEPITQETFAHPSSGKNYEERIFHEPFWSIYWPGGQALTRFILDQGINLLNKSHGGTSFLDIGSGCGASAIAAKMIGASRAVANDIDQEKIASEIADSSPQRLRSKSSGSGHTAWSIGLFSSHKNDCFYFPRVHRRNAHFGERFFSQAYTPESCVCSCESECLIKRC